MRDVVYVLSVMFILFYSVSVGMPQSVQRASFIFSFHRLIPLVWPNPSKVNSLLFILIFQTMIFPIGFFTVSTLLSWLSYLIVLDMCSVSAGKELIKKVLINQCWLMCLIGAFFGKLSIIGVFINILLVPVFSFIYCAAFFLIFFKMLPGFLVGCLVALQHAFLDVIVFFGRISVQFSFLFIDLIQYHHIIRWGVICLMLFTVMQVVSRLAKHQ